MSPSQNEELFPSITGRMLPIKDNIPGTVLGFLKKLMETNAVDALLVPVQVSNSQAFAWVLLQELSLLDQANPLPPAMSISGGRTLSGLTHRGTFDLKVAVVMRPCEARAAVELHKIKQVHLDNIFIITFDCPGAVPLGDYVNDSKKMTDLFQNIVMTGEDSEHLRPICRSCRHFSLPALLPSTTPQSGEKETTEGIPAVDLHIGYFGQNGKKMLIIPASPDGQKLVDEAGLNEQESLEQWRKSIQTVLKKREKKHSEMEKELLGDLKGVDAFTAAFDACINCHNCMRVCPICYCRQCYFDSQYLNLPTEHYMDRAEHRGALRFPMDPILFHLGRMSHMVLSCVSCGACEDACPVSIPVARIFSAVGDNTRKDFQYVPGRDRNESPPLQIYSEEELCEVETPSECAEKPAEEVKHNA